MREGTVRGLGLAGALAYAAFIGWVYVRQPQTVAEVTGGLAASVGVYRIDRQAFEDGLRFFRDNQFVAARAAFERADPARQDARTQFYVGYSYYRQGWGRMYNDDLLFSQGLDAVTRAIELAPGGRLIAGDPSLKIQTAEELRDELEAGMRLEASDLNPLRVFRQRQ